MNRIIFVIATYALLTGCTAKSEPDIAIKRLHEIFNSGEFSGLRSYADSLRKRSNLPSVLSLADSLVDMSERIKNDFSLNEQVFDSLLILRAGKHTQEERAVWEKNGWLEWRYIDGKRMYFNRAASNLVLQREFHLNRANRDSAESNDPRIKFRKRHTEAIIAASAQSSIPADTVEMEITYTLTVNPDAVPEGETIRCWLPYPKENNQRQSSVYLKLVSNEDFIISPDTATHKTIYMEQKAVKGKPAVFKIAFIYKSAGQYFNPENISKSEYDKSSALYKKYTSEQPPQINFSDKVRQLADSLTGNEKNPLEITRIFFNWFNKSVPWAGALEYSIMPDIPGYVIANRKGDCGMQTFLLMSMLRYKGIPVRWQSGWMVPPGAENLHDWCEIYYEGTGWVPADISYGLQHSERKQTREFYISGIDSYRMIINDDISGNLYPPKKFMRSEPYDFQRGEVEWDGGNIYFDNWDYEMEILYKNE